MKFGVVSLVSAVLRIKYEMQLILISQFFYKSSVSCLWFLFCSESRYACRPVQRALDGIDVKYSINLDYQ